MQMNPYVRTVRVMLLLQAATFLAAAVVHAGYLIAGYQHRQARIAETTIGIVLLAGLACIRVRPAWTRAAGLTVQGLALLGTLVGAFTIVIGVGPRTVPDMIYHVGLLVVLIWGLAITAQGTGRLRPFGLVLAGGLVAGALDITYAWVFWALKAGVSAQQIFQSVAAGLLGKASFEGGAATAALGLVLHFFIATSMSLTYYLVARHRPLLRRRPVACGAGYGLLLYGIMNFVVVPLSAARSGGPKDPLWVGLSVLVHVVLIGIPIALFARRAARAEVVESRQPV